MGDFLGRLVSREFGTMQCVVPRFAALFEEEPSPIHLPVYGFEPLESMGSIHGDEPSGRPRELESLPDAPGDSSRVTRLVADGLTSTLVSEASAVSPEERNDQAPRAATRSEPSIDGAEPPIRDTLRGHTLGAIRVPTLQERVSAAVQGNEAGDAAAHPWALTAKSISDEPQTFEPSASEAGEGTALRRSFRRSVRSSHVAQPPSRAAHQTVRAGQDSSIPGGRDFAMQPMARKNARAMLRLPAMAAEDVGTAAKPTIEITIDRVEVQTSANQSPVSRRAIAPRALSLAEYLRQRSEARRR